MTIRQQGKRNRLVLVGFAMLLAVALVVLARGGLFPFILSGALTYLLYPVVRGLEKAMHWRQRWPGPSRIAAIAVVAGALAFMVPPAFRLTKPRRPLPRRPVGRLLAPIRVAPWTGGWLELWGGGERQ